VPILFFIGGFHFDHLYKWHVTVDVTLCMITKFMNKWMFTFCKYRCFPFHYVYLMQGVHHILLDICKYLMMQSSIWQMVHTRTSEDPILDIPEGSLGHGHGQIPRGGAPPPPPRPPISLEQLLATQNDLMRRLVENDKHRGAKRQQLRHRERDSSYLDFFSNSPAQSTGLGYFTAQSTRRLCTPHNNWEAQLEPGGPYTSPPYLLITKFHGASSVLPSMHISYLRVCSTPC
jgi:hypothetical protein